MIMVNVTDIHRLVLFICSSMNIFEPSMFFTNRTHSNLIGYRKLVWFVQKRFHFTWPSLLCHGIGLGPIMIVPTMFCNLIFSRRIISQEMSNSCRRSSPTIATSVEWFERCKTTIVNIQHATTYERFQNFTRSIQFQYRVLE